MTTYHTNNPLGSTDPRDLYDNAQNFDFAINGTGEFWDNRFGVSGFTMAGYRADYDKIVNNLAPLGKVYTADQATAAITAGEISDGSFFFIWSDDEKSIADKYQNIAGVATPTGDSYPSTAFVEHVNDRLDGGFSNQFMQAPATTGVGESIARTRVEGDNFTENGELYSVTIFAETAGSATVKIVTPGSSNLTFSLVSEFGVTLVVGENVFVSGIHFHDTTVTTAQTIAIFSNVGRLSVSANGGGTTGSSYIYNGDLTGNNVVVTPTTNEMQIKATIITGTGIKYEDVVNQVEQISETVNGTSLLIGAMLPSSTGTGESVVRTRILGDTATASGYLNKIKLFAHTGGSAKIKVVRKVSSTLYSLINEFDVTCMAGANEFSSEQFGRVEIAAGDSIGFYGSTARIEASATGVGPNGVSLIYNGDLTGENITVTPTTNIMQLNADITVSISYNQLVDMASDAYSTSRYVEQQVELIPNAISDALRGSVQTETQLFTGASLPSGWATYGSAWSINNSLQASGSGSATTIANFDSYSAMARKITRARIKMIDSSSRAGISFTPQEASRGTAVLINGSTGLLELNSYTGAALTLSRTVALPAAIVANREYMLEVRKVGISTEATLRDTVTGALVSITQSQGDGGIDAGAQHGKPGIMFISGNISVSRFEFVSCVQQKPAFILLGDSIVEGSNNGADWPKCWGYLLEDARGKGDTLIAARGGDETPNLLPRLAMDLNQFSPKYVIYEIGTNDTTQAEWRANTQAVINAIVARGSIPVLCTQVPRPGKQAQITAQNADIRSHYFGGYSYIDLALAVSVNNDGVTYNPMYYLADNVHLNVAGEHKLFEQVLADAPYLLD